MTEVEVRTVYPSDEELDAIERVYHGPNHRMVLDLVRAARDRNRMERRLETCLRLVLKRIDEVTEQGSEEGCGSLE